MLIYPSNFSYLLSGDAGGRGGGEGGGGWGGRREQGGLNFHIPVPYIPSSWPFLSSFHLKISPYILPVSATLGILLPVTSCTVLALSSPRFLPPPFSIYSTPAPPPSLTCSGDTFLTNTINQWVVSNLKGPLSTIMLCVISVIQL